MRMESVPGAEEDAEKLLGSTNDYKYLYFLSPNADSSSEGQQNKLTIYDARNITKDAGSKVLTHFENETWKICFLNGDNFVDPEIRCRNYAWMNNLIYMLIYRFHVYILSVDPGDLAVPEASDSAPPQLIKHLILKDKEYGANENLSDFFAQKRKEEIENTGEKKQQPTHSSLSNSNAYDFRLISHVAPNDSSIFKLQSFFTFFSLKYTIADSYLRKLNSIVRNFDPFLYIKAGYGLQKEEAKSNVHHFGRYFDQFNGVVICKKDLMEDENNAARQHFEEQFRKNMLYLFKKNMMGQTTTPEPLRYHSPGNLFFFLDYDFGKSSSTESINTTEEQYTSLFNKLDLSNETFSSSSSSFQ